MTLFDLTHVINYSRIGTNVWFLGIRLGYEIMLMLGKENKYKIVQLNKYISTVQSPSSDCPATARALENGHCPWTK